MSGAYATVRATSLAAMFDVAKLIGQSRKRLAEHTGMVRYASSIGYASHCVKLSVGLHQEEAFLDQLLDIRSRLYEMFYHD